MALQLKKEYPSSERPALIEAAQFCKEKQVTKAVEALQVRVI